MAKTSDKQADKSGVDSWANILRAAINADGRSRYAISKAANVEQSQLARFMSGSSVNLATAERLGAVVGLELVAKRYK